MATDDRTRVLVAVAPLMLGDVLSRVLARDDLDVIVYEADGSSSLSFEAHFDVAVASACLPEGVNADTIIRLPDDFGNAGMGALVTVAGEQAAPIRRLDGLLQLFDRLCPRPEPLEPLGG
ncbi:MAG: hypothetical protein M3276_09880 [Actinomycetota bacterium]|nr:hypothetical protein [Actinomycetota bacterium]